MRSEKIRNLKAMKTKTAFWAFLFIQDIQGTIISKISLSPIKMQNKFSALLENKKAY